MTEPFPLVAVIVYVVVPAGDTLCEPLLFGVNVMPGSGTILTLSALDDVHARVEEPPAVMSSGDAEMLTEGSWVTVTVTLAVLEPYEFTAVMV